MSTQPEFLVISGGKTPEMMVDLSSIIAITRDSMATMKVHVSDSVSYRLPYDRAEAIVDIIHKDPTPTFLGRETNSIVGIVRLLPIAAVVPNSDGFDAYFKSGAHVRLSNEMGNGILKVGQSLVNSKQGWFG